MEAFAHTHWFAAGVVGVIWLLWLTLAVAYLIRHSPRTLELEVADLTDRFTAWQKRENLRRARAAISDDSELLNQVLALAQAQPQQSTPTAPNVADLKARLRARAFSGGST